MAVNTYGTATSGNPTNVHAVVELLKSADAVECCDKLAKTIPVPGNKSETISLLRAVTPDVTGFSEGAEGVNATPRALAYEQVTRTFEEYDLVLGVSSRQAELGEYDVLMHSKDRMLDMMRRIREQNAWANWQTGTNVAYNSSAHSARTDVNGPITLGRLQVATREILNARASYIRKATKGSVNQDTTPVEPAFGVLCHTDCRNDIRNLPGFVPAPRVGGLADTLPQLFGYVNDVFFVTSQEFVPFLAGGASVGSTGMKSAGGTSIDVYSYVMFGAEALGKVSLRGSGKGGFGGVELNVLDKADKSDPTNKRRLVACRWWDAPLILNDNWVYRVECGVTANPA